MSKIKINLIFLVNLLFLIFFNSISQAESKFFIVTKVDNEIITNIDIIQEANYLIALNNDLAKIDKQSLINLARESLIREKSRGGQSFIIQNDIEKIERTREQINELLPNFQIGIAHGRLNKRDIKKVMNEFKNGSLDVLIQMQIQC